MDKPTYLYLIVFCFFVFIGISCEEESDPSPNTEPDLNTIIASDPQFSLMKEAMDHANLGPTLNGSGPYTLFLPTNEAFEDYLVSEGVGSLLDVPRNTLSRRLLPHIIQNTVPGSQLADGYLPTIAVESSSLNSISLYISSLTGINGLANLEQTDIPASNGVIHTVDAVIPTPHLWTHLQSNPEFLGFFSACNQLGLPFEEAFTGQGPFTLFVPNNSAIDAFLSSNPAWNNDLSAVPLEELEAVLSFHVVPNQNVLENGFTNGLGLNTLHDSGNSIISLTENGGLFELNRPGGGSVPILGINIQGSNGVIHIIGEVLIP